MMKEMGYDLCCGEDLNFKKGRRIHLQPFIQKEKPTNYFDQTHRGLGYVTPPTMSDSEEESNCSLPSHSSDSSN